MSARAALDLTLNCLADEGPGVFTFGARLADPLQRPRRETHQELLRPFQLTPQLFRLFAYSIC